MIKEIKIGNKVLNNFEEKIVDEDEKVIWNIPQNLEEFKAIALDTINWQIGNNVKKSLGNTNVNLSASNAKAIILLAKLINPTQTQLDTLTTLEKDSFEKMKALAEGGYADSNLLNASLTNVSDFIEIGTNKASRVATAQSIDEVIAILNEV